MALTFKRTFGLFFYFVLVLLLNNARAQLVDVDVGCTERSFRFGEQCYTFMGRQPYTFTEAREVCASIGGVVASPSNKESYLFLKKLAIRMLTHGYWMGISDAKEEGKWIYKSDENEIGFKLWYQREPNNANVNENCAIININHGNQWNDITCESQEYYICQFQDGPDSTNCKSAPKFQGNCYWLSQQLLTYKAAETDCRAKGGLLVEIKNEEQHNFIRSAIYNEKWWMKPFSEEDINAILKTTGYRGGFYWTWLGITFKDSTQKWIYENGTNVNFDMWAEGEPNNKLVNQEKCVAFSWENWIDVSCAFEANVICMMKINRSKFKIIV